MADVNMIMAAVIGDVGERSGQIRGGGEKSWVSGRLKWID
jgi:hypothetical protein